MRALFLLFCLFSNIAIAQIEQIAGLPVLPKALSVDEQGFMTNETGDSYFTVDKLDLNRAEACFLLIDLEFKQPLEKGALFDLYWHTAKSNFTERQKGSFIVNPQFTDKASRFLIPLCKLYNYSGNLSTPNAQNNITQFRFDFPINKTIAVKINEFQWLSDEQAQAQKAALLLEPFERISAMSFGSLDVVMPKMLFIFQHGLQRLTQDIGFLVFWLLLLLLFLGLIVLSCWRQYLASKQDK